ncbi:MAG: hypothetical protein GY798_03510 [Hyphomicrobiales bacterium]|nr:hypothetical protein [Hyphomicrobiales bacterium]
MAGRLASMMMAAWLTVVPVSATAGDGDEGYVLYAPLASTSTYLVDGQNHAAAKWNSTYKAGQSAYLLDDGSLLRAGMMQDQGNFFARTLAALPDQALGFNVGGVVERISPDGQVAWRFRFFDDTVMPHHDVEILPNDNILMIAWEYKSRKEAIASGRDPTTVTDNGLWVDAVFEIQPAGAEGGRIVWEWHAWDHLIQNYDISKDNYGVLSENPTKLDINNSRYILLPADLMHTNSVRYNEELDQILLSSYNYSELWIIDHSTTSEESASETGGRHGKGGGFLYRWGNPAAYGYSDTGAYRLGGLHDPNWAGSNRQIILFDNNAPNGDSRVVEIMTPLRADGSYGLLREGFFGPLSPDFEIDLGFTEVVVGAAQRLWWGAAFSCQCMDGRAVFIRPDGTIEGERGMAEGRQKAHPAAFRLVFYQGDHPGVKAVLAAR